MDPKKILIADDDQALAKALAMRCQELGATVRTSSDGLHAYQALLKEPPDLLIVDVNMPAAGGLDICQELGHDERFATIPMIVLTGQSDFATIERCQRLCAHYVWKGSDTWDRLRPLVIKLLKLEGDGSTSPAAESPAQTPAAATVLVVDDDPDTCKAFKLRLESQGCKVVTASCGAEGFQLALAAGPDLIITDYMMPSGPGNYLLGRIRTHEMTKRIPVFVLTGRTVGGQRDYGIQRELFGLGADRFFTKPPDFGQIVREMHACLGHSSVPV